MTANVNVYKLERGENYPQYDSIPAALLAKTQCFPWFLIMSPDLKALAAPLGKSAYGAYLPALILRSAHFEARE